MATGRAVFGAQGGVGRFVRRTGRVSNEVLEEPMVVAQGFGKGAPMLPVLIAVPRALELGLGEASLGPRLHTSK